MITQSDMIALPDGVSVVEGELTDDVRAMSWPVNAVAAFVLGRTGAPLGATVTEIARAFSLSEEQARADVLGFVWQLNALALVNVERQGSRMGRAHEWVVLAARLAPAGTVPALLARRRRIDTRTPTRGFISCLVAAWRRMVVICAVMTVLAAQLVALAGSHGLALPLVLGLASGVGAGLHEAGHAAALRGVPSALVTHGRRTFVLHAPVSPARRSGVALAGPLAVAALGFALMIVAVATAAPVLAAAGCPFAAHALGLTVLASDGRTACRL